MVGFRLGLAGATAAVALTAAAGLITAPAEAAPRAKVDFVAIGDSFTAGTGSGGEFRPAGLPCWQSPPGYPGDLGATGRINLVTNAACHDAALSQSSPFYDGLTPTVTEQIAKLAVSRQLSATTGMVTITAGGTDVGASKVLGGCAIDPQHCAGYVDSAVNAAQTLLLPALVQTYNAIHSQAPNAKIGVVGYVHFFNPSSGIPTILTPANQQLVNAGTDKLNAVLAQAAGIAAGEGAKTQYVDAAGKFAGHEANTTDPWVAFDPTNPTADSNFHPNAAGYINGYMAAVLSQLKPAQL
ncbi:SGNH/GDSL hydrolase family protein [Arthrobacter sp. fls2-241-R2A-200]|uniref:SGNH/GDSL hydrolase family protein n=1 Tax=Arthrobacter sp. fls2-241-R2A-200 TaxID=3040281 RepID=UPI00254FB078|nr:SGNH/GDSL hydrolase family protein [Arthrobacter sp. fls2-241-R2A-200]